MKLPWLPYSRFVHMAPVPGAPALAVQQVSVRYPGTVRWALESLSVCLPRGIRVALVGPNGAGKSTLLKAVAGLLPFQTGTISIYGHAPGRCPYRVAYLPQPSDLAARFPISVAGLVRIGRYVHLGWLRRPGSRETALTMGVLDRLGLHSLAVQRISDLSGGQQQRLLVARALVQEADLLLFDEPLNAVDTATRAIVADVLLELQQHGKTIVVATHDMGRLATDFDQWLSLDAGRLVPPPCGALTGGERQ
jgi:ABC-type Mn2+/Zn2+ transport system ATPase subunit